MCVWQRDAWNVVLPAEWNHKKWQARAPWIFKLVKRKKGKTKVEEESPVSGQENVTELRTNGKAGHAGFLDSSQYIEGCVLY